MLVRTNGETRLEIVTEQSVESTETLLLGAYNLEESHGDAIVEVLKRQLLRRFASSAPTLEELQERVREQPRGKGSGASEPVAVGAVRVGGGGNAALRTRLASTEPAPATAPPGQGKRPRSGASQPAGQRKWAPAMAGAMQPSPAGSMGAQGSSLHLSRLPQGAPHLRK